jgi:hypothetical protein
MDYVEVAEVFCFYTARRFHGKPLASTTRKHGGGVLYEKAWMIWQGKN